MQSTTVRIFRGSGVFYLAGGEFRNNGVAKTEYRTGGEVTKARQTFLGDSLNWENMKNTSVTINCVVTYLGGECGNLHLP